MFEYSDFFQLLACFDPTSDHFLEENMVIGLAQRYANFFDEIAIETIRFQNSTAKHLLLSECPKELIDVYNHLNKLPAAFDQLIMLIKIILTLPVSTASKERFFSVLKRLKNYVRSTCGNERLSDLMLMAHEST